MKALVSYLRLPVAEQGTTLWVIVVAAAVEYMIRRWPLPCVTRMLGVLWVDDRAVDRRGGAKQLSARDHRVVRCTRRVMRRWPFCEGTCLRQSLIVGFALRRHGPRLRLGVARSGGAFGAHAWLDVCDASIGASAGFHSLHASTRSAA